jgi:hypothetical protein
LEIHAHDNHDVEDDGGHDDHDGDHHRRHHRKNRGLQESELDHAADDEEEGNHDDHEEPEEDHRDDDHEEVEDQHGDEEEDHGGEGGGEGVDHAHVHDEKVDDYLNGFFAPIWYVHAYAAYAARDDDCWSHSLFCHMVQQTMFTICFFKYCWDEIHLTFVACVMMRTSCYRSCFCC